jgi:hypothetical protein
MDHRPTALERAFDLARSGKCADVAQIRQQLKIEGYARDQLTGPKLIRQLRELCIAATAAVSDDAAAVDEA